MCLSVCPFSNCRDIGVCSAVGFRHARVTLQMIGFLFPVQDFPQQLQGRSHTALELQSGFLFQETAEFPFLFSQLRFGDHIAAVLVLKEVEIAVVFSQPQEFICRI